MHTLSRQIRFSINPFSDEPEAGYNSYASKPCGQGLSVYLALWVDLKSPLNPDTGFVVNVSKIDKVVRQKAIPIFMRVISEAFTQQKVVSLSDLASVLESCWHKIQSSFPSKELVKLRLELNPFRSISIHAENTEMFIFSEKFEFAAMHRLWNEQFDSQKNEECFGKCANPAGHGHNYVLEVNLQRPRQTEPEGWMCDIEKIVEDNFLNLVDHKNLNVDVEEFEKLNPTVENLAYFAWEKLEDKFKNGKLVKITVWENDRTHCSYSGQ